MSITYYDIMERNRLNALNVSLEEVKARMQELQHIKDIVNNLKSFNPQVFYNLRTGNTIEFSEIALLLEELILLKK